MKGKTVVLCPPCGERGLQGCKGVIHKGFTLIEVLVVVLIIGVLAAVALPQYQKATLKSRFSTVMPIAKAVVDAQEVYFLTNGQYTRTLANLDVASENAVNTEIVLSNAEEGQNYNYVMTYHKDFPNARYIMYQKHSANYPGEIHCEAEDTSEKAQWLCDSLSERPSIGAVLNSGYTTYILQGSGMGVAPGVDEDVEDENGQVTPSCDKAEAMGYSCSITEDEQGRQVKQVCTVVDNSNICRTKTYNEDGSYTRLTCKVDSSGMCDKYSSGYFATYDSNGNMTSQRTCGTGRVTSAVSCSWWYSGVSYDYTYDANGNMTSQRQCSSVVPDTGKCSVYKNDDSYDYTYDVNGNMTSRWRCHTIAGDGSCSEYAGSRTDYTYDANGNMTSQRGCEAVAADGSCSAYSSSRVEYTYDANGNKTSQRTCQTVAADGSCSAYRSGIDYTYDANGNMTSERVCQTVAADGSCSKYNLYSDNYDYTYDANGNMTSKRYCRPVAADGSCSAYSNSGAYDYTYDANGNMTSQLKCSSVAGDGSCSVYSDDSLGAIYYAYDDDGKEIARQYCSYFAFDTSTGKCTSYIQLTLQNP